MKLGVLDELGQRDATGVACPDVHLDGHGFLPRQLSEQVRVCAVVDVHLSGQVSRSVDHRLLERSHFPIFRGYRKRFMDA